MLQMTLCIVIWGIIGFLKFREWHDNKHLYRLKETSKGYKKVSIRTLYKAIYNKPFCDDTIKDLENEQWSITR